jgi:Secretion system C-terminal sorting domain
MKLYYALVVCVAAFFQTNAQEYVPMLDKLNEWKLTTCNSGCLTDTYFTDGDTLVAGTSFKILDGYHYISRSFLLREDIAEKKVYIKIFLPNREENYLLYDFSLVEGDTFDMYNPITPFPTEGGTFVLDSIISRPLANSELYRHFYFSPAPGNTSSTQNAVWIEGVGSLSMVTAPGGYPNINEVGHLSCAFKNTERIYENLDSITSCEAAILRINDVKMDVWNLQFFRENETITIENATEVLRVSIFSLSGSKVLEQENTTKAKQLFLSTEQLTDGLYILQAQGSKNRTKSFKFIVD